MTTSLLAIDDPRWTSLVHAQADVSPFHDPGWISAVADCYRFDAFVIAFSTGSEVVAGVPAVEVGKGRRKRWVALPFTDRCHPVARDEQAGQEFGAALGQLRGSKNLSQLEVRGSRPWLSGYDVPCGYWHELVLDQDPDELMKRFHKLRRRMLARAAEAGVESRVSRDHDDLCDVFFRLHVATRKRLGVPVQPRKLFELIWQRVVAPGNGFVQIASVDGVPVAAGLFLTSTNRVSNKFAARSDDYTNAGGMDAMYMGAMQWGYENGRSIFDFGRTEAGNDGLRKFKLGWATTEQELHYMLVASEPPAPGHGRERIEEALAMTIRRSPAWVARVVGEVAYRYAA
jgi:CelD/BcsL family acetyltransferase involved in cellulose biosynthesis